MFDSYLMNCICLGSMLPRPFCGALSGEIDLERDLELFELLDEEEEDESFLSLCG